VLTSYVLVALTLATEPAGGYLEEQWYGGPAVASDVASSVAIIWGAKMHQNGEPRAGLAVAYVGVGGLLLGAPLNHLAHGHPRHAGESLALRLVGGVVAVGLGLAGVALAIHGNDSDGYLPFLLGVGCAVTVPIVDDVSLARAPVRTPSAAPVAFSPSLVVGPGSNLFGVRGTF